MSEETDTTTEEQPEAAANAQEQEQQEDAPEAFDAARAQEKIRKLNSEAKNLRERAKDAEELKKSDEAKTEQVRTLEAENLRLRMAIKTGLPETLANRLQGGTEEELLKDAEELLDLLGGKKPPTDQPRERLRGGGDPTQGSDPTLSADFAERMFKN